jgi:hypothetical protein
MWMTSAGLERPAGGGTPARLLGATGLLNDVVGYSDLHSRRLQVVATPQAMFRTPSGPSVSPNDGH